ncbi:MAG: sensor histidine kinase [Sarcina sp.]
MNYDIIILFLLVILIFEFFREIKKKNKIKEKELNLVQKLAEEYKEFKTFRHDYQNILISISGYIEEKDLEGLEKFFYNEIFDNNPIENINIINYGMVFNIDIPEVRGLILSKINEAEKRNIKIGVECKSKIKDLTIDKIKIIRILGILLDNAIEGAKEHKNPKVSISFEICYENMSITIVNNYNGKKNNDIYKYGVSSKGSNRGIGLYNVDKILKTLPTMTLNTKEVSEYFIQEILIEII